MKVTRSGPDPSDPFFYVKVLEENRKLKEEIKTLKEEIKDEIGGLNES